MRSRQNAIAAIASALLLAGCAAGPTAGPTAPASPRPSVIADPGPAAAPVLRPQGDPVAASEDLVSPWSVAWTSDGVAPLSERDTNRILERLPDGTLREAGVVAGVVNGGEGGLLGLAIDDRDRLYAYSSGEAGNRIERFELTGTAGSLGLGAPTTILDGIPRAGNHNGGRIAFGPDGMLYAGTGDAGARDGAQDLAYLGGKILRMTPDGGVPEDNPFPDSLVWTLGHRNVQGLAWGADGTMFASEFGQDTWDELNVISPGSNYGWPLVEGAGGAASGFADPVQQWPTDAASPSGIAVAGGSVLIANLRGAVLRLVPMSDLAAHEDFYPGVHGRLRDAAIGPDGRLWLLTNETDGRGSPEPGDDRLLVVRLG